jgi:hypothetical protein
MKHEDYPALFLDADAGSNAYQARFLRLICGEYLALLIASVLSMGIFSSVVFYVLYAATFFIGLAILLVRAQGKPEQWWYRCRALAESSKTLTWRYMMHATPFNGQVMEAKLRFRDELHAMLRENIDTAKAITNDWSGNNQITRAMEDIRAMKRAERMAYYLQYRVDDQRAWYNHKSKSNRASARRWVWVSVVSYLLAGSMVLIRIARPDMQNWPIEPLIVVAASVIGWMQIKKFNELAAAYTVAAHEIGMIRPKADAVKSDDQFSEFVNDAEKAFSREHTLWIARQSD